jgi:hypothetical protein
MFFPCLSKREKNQQEGRRLFGRQVFIIDPESIAMVCNNVVEILPLQAGKARRTDKRFIVLDSGQKNGGGAGI